MCAEGACGLVVLHHTVIIQDLPTAVTETHMMRFCLQKKDPKLHHMVESFDLAAAAILEFFLEVRDY